MSDKKDVKLSRLREVMRNSHLNDTEISKLTGIDRTLIGRHSSGERKISTADLIRYCQAFNVSADYLLGLSGAPTTDKDLQSVCDFTGLNEEAVLFFSKNKRIENKCSDLDSSVEFVKMLIKELSEKGLYTSMLIEEIRELTTAMYTDLTTDEDELIEEQEKNTLVQIDGEPYVKSKRELISSAVSIINGDKYELMQMLNNFVDSFSVSNIEGLSFEELQKQKEDFYND